MNTYISMVYKYTEQLKSLTKLQKSSYVIFPIITVLLYLYLIFKFAI